MKKVLPFILLPALSLAKQPGFVPVREILAAMNKAEKNQIYKEQLKVAGQGVQWETSASPTASRSWLYYNLSPDNLNSLINNKDSSGKPLF